MNVTLDVLLDPDVALDDVPDERVLQTAATRACRHADERDAVEIALRIVGPDESQALNRQWREKDAPTNVLAFPGVKPEGMTLPPDESRHLGDLVICADIIAAEALAQGKSPAHHWQHMIVHGVLHLLGHDHVDSAQALAMESLEREILATLDVPDPYH